MSAILMATAAASILLSTSPRLAAQDADWTVAEQATVSIGGDTGPVRDLFDVRGVVRSRGGQIIIAEAQRILTVAPNGRDLLRIFGGAGQGPGEFGAVEWIQRLPIDTLLVIDHYNGRRVSYFSSNGDFVRSVRPSVVPWPRIKGALADGTLLSTRTHREARTTRSEFVRLYRGQLELLRLDPEGNVLSSFGVFPDHELLVIPDVMSMSSRTYTPANPLHRTVIVPGDREIYVATGTGFEVQVFSPEGERLRVIRRDTPSRPLTPAHLIDHLLGLPAWTQQLERVEWDGLRWDLPEGQMLAAITELLVDEVGNLWIEEGRTDPDAQGTWQVYDVTGAYLATATMPARFRPFYVEADSVLGVWRDGLDVEYVQVRSIIKR